MQSNDISVCKGVDSLPSNITSLTKVVFFQQERKLRVHGRMLWPIIGEDRVKNEQQNFCTIYAQFVISEVLQIEIV